MPKRTAREPQEPKPEARAVVGHRIGARVPRAPGARHGVPRKRANPIDEYVRLHEKIELLEKQRTTLKEELVNLYGQGDHEGHRFAIQIQYSFASAKDEIFKAKVQKLILENTKHSWRVKHTNHTYYYRILPKVKVNGPA